MVICIHVFDRENDFSVSQRELNQIKGQYIEFAATDRITNEMKRISNGNDENRLKRVNNNLTL